MTKVVCMRQPGSPSPLPGSSASNKESRDEIRKDERSVPRIPEVTGQKGSGIVHVDRNIPILALPH